MDEKKIKVDIKADLDTSEAERKTGTLTENIRTRIKQLQKGVEEYQYHTGRIEEGARDPGRMEWTEQQERRIRGTHEYIKSHLTDVPDSLKQSMSQFEQTRERMEDLRLQGLDIGETPAVKLSRAQISRLGEITDPQQRGIAHSMAGQFLRQVRQEGERAEGHLMRRMFERYAEVEGMPEEERAKAIENLERSFDSMTQTLAHNKQVLQELNEEWYKHDERLENRTSRLLPAYASAAIAVVSQGAKLYADLRYAEKTMFDLGGPSSMAISQMQRDIYETEALWGRGGKLAGGAAGGIIGGMWTGAKTGALLGPWGAMAGALAGLYLGGQIGGEAGDFISRLITADKQKELQIFQNLAGRAMQYAEQFGGVQAQEYTVAARTGWELAPEEFRERYGRFARLGVGRDQAGQLEMMFQEARGEATVDTEAFEELLRFQRATRFDPGTVFNLASIRRLTGTDVTEDDRLQVFRTMASRMGMQSGSQLEQEFLQNIPMYFQMAGGVLAHKESIDESAMRTMQLPSTIFGDRISEMPVLQTEPGRQQLLQGLHGVLTPQSQAHEALLFSAFQAEFGEDESFYDIMFRMRQGIFGKGNLEALLKHTPREYGEMTGFALTESMSNTELAREIMGLFATGEIGDTVRKFMDLSEDEQRALAEGMDVGDKIPRVEEFQANIRNMMLNAGENMQGTITRTTEQWESYITGLVSSGGFLGDMTDKLGEAFGRLKDILDDRYSESEPTPMAEPRGWLETAATPFTNKKTRDWFKRRFSPDRPSGVSGPIDGQVFDRIDMEDVEATAIHDEIIHSDKRSYRVNVSIEELETAPGVVPSNRYQY